MAKKFVIDSSIYVQIKFTTFFANVHINDKKYLQTVKNIGLNNINPN